MPDPNIPGPSSGDGSLSVGRDIHGNIIINNANSRTLSKPPVLNLLPLMFDRDVQEQQVLEHLKQCLQQRQQIIPLVLAGAYNEGPGDFVERYAKLSLREVSQKLIEADVYECVKSAPLEWPRKNRTLEERFQRLSESLCWKVKAISKHQPDPKEPPEYRFETKGKHQILYYFLMADQAAKDEAELLERWIDFWLNVQLDSPKATVTIIFCLHSERSWLPFGRDWTSRCITGLGCACKDNSAVLLLSPLTAPRKKRDAYMWAMMHCQRAWEIAHLGQDVPFLLNAAVLHKSALNAFGWFRRKRPLLHLLPELSKAVEEAYKV